MAAAISACVHCGFCLPTCPTYLLMGEEMDSPRGRIFLMKEVLEGEMRPESAEPYIDNCLGCQACLTSCPSGVQYGELINAYRAWRKDDGKLNILKKAQRKLLLKILPHPNRLQKALVVSKVGKHIAPLLPVGVRAMLNLAPSRSKPVEPLHNRYTPNGEQRARVGLMLGCAQQVLAPEINVAVIQLLNRHGVEVIIPHGQACCGSLALHIGEEMSAINSARQNLDLFPGELNAIITTAAGCSSGIKEYGLLFKGQPDENASREFAKRTLDVTVFVDRLGYVPDNSNGRFHGKRVAYQDACHLAHAQGVRDAPRRLLKAVPGLILLEPREWEICCGSAGTYNIDHPDVADELGKRKLDNPLADKPDIIVSGNIGCIMQIRQHLARRNLSIPVLHTAQVI
jgi:glycolate oxidase iron-sulfur subunit